MFPDYFRDDVFRVETQRLWLRWPMAADAPAIERLAGEAEVAQFTARISHPYPRGGGQVFVLAAREANVSGAALHLALAPKAKPAAAIGVISLEGSGAAVELGYWLGQPYWGSGFMTEAVESLLDLVWLGTDIDHIEARAALANARSRRLLERAGFDSLGETLIDAPARGAPLPARRFELKRARARFGSAPSLRGAGLSAGCAGM